MTRTLAAGGRLVVAAVLVLVGAAVWGASPAAASTKRTCFIGFSGTCTTASVWPEDGIFKLGTGAHPSPLAMDVVETGSNRIHTSVIVQPGGPYHFYRGGFDNSKRYYLSAQCRCSNVVVSIE